MKLIRVLAITIVITGLLAGCNTSTVGELYVCVQNTQGEPMEGAKVVSNMQPEGQLKVTGITNSEGWVFFKDIKAGNYEFYASYHGQEEFNVTVKAGDIIVITVFLSPS